MRLKRNRAERARAASRALAEAVVAFERVIESAKRAAEGLEQMAKAAGRVRGCMGRLVTPADVVVHAVHIGHPELN